GPERRRWLRIGVFAAALSVVFLPWHVRMLEGMGHRIHRDGKLYADLRAVGHSPTVRQAFDVCKPLSAADHRPIPYLRWWLDGPPNSVGTIEHRASPL